LVPHPPLDSNLHITYYIHTYLLFWISSALLLVLCLVLLLLSVAVGSGSDSCISAYRNSVIIPFIILILILILIALLIAYLIPPAPCAFFLYPPPYPSSLFLTPHIRLSVTYIPLYISPVAYHLSPIIGRIFFFYAFSCDLEIPRLFFSFFSFLFVSFLYSPFFILLLILFTFSLLILFPLF